jgi:hypothetical protein
MSRTETFSAPASRPYLYLIVEGPNGWSGPVLGLVDSGADTSCFPDGAGGNFFAMFRVSFDEPGQSFEVVPN